VRTGSPHNQLISRCIDSYYDTIIKNSKITVTQYYNDNKKTVTRYIRERYAEHTPGFFKGERSEIKKIK